MRVLILLFLCLSLLTGCSLFGPSVEKAQEVAEKRQTEFDAAVDAFKAAEAELTDVLTRLDQAIKDDDADAVQKLTTLAQAASIKYEATKQAAISAEDLFQSAVQDFKDAKSTSDYLGTILGWLGMGVTAVLGGGGTVGALIGRARAREAVAGTTAALEKVKAAPRPEDAWPSAKADLQATLSLGALKTIDKLRP